MYGHENLLSKSQSPEAEKRLALLRSPVARVVFLIAPAGYGKTTAANTLRAEYKNSGVCDCECNGVKSFARNVMAALKAENPEEFAFYSQLQAQLAGIEDDEGESRNLLITAWNKQAPNSLFVFENAEAIAGNAAVVPLLTELLNSAPASRRIIVCSRTPLPNRTSRYLPPHRLSTLSTRHFALSEAEAETILRQEGVEPAHWQRIISLARGWPVVLLLLARLSVEGRLESALADAKDVAFEDLFTYLIHEVLAPLEPTVKSVMAFCAVVPDVTSQEICAATGQSTIELENTLRKALLVQREETSFTIHPLVREALIQTTPDLQGLLLPVAGFAEKRGNSHRAALLYRLAEAYDDAARVLAALSPQELETPDNAFELTRLPLSSIRRHVALVAASEAHRSDITVELLRESFERLSERDDPQVIAAVAAAYIDHVLGAEQRMEILDSVLVRRAVDASLTARTLLAGWTETIAAFTATVSVEHSIREAYTLVQQAGLRAHSARMAHTLDVIARRQGDREASLHWQALAVEHARYCGPRLHAGYLLAGMFTVWFWGDDEAVKRYQEELESAESATHHPDYAWVLRALDPQTFESALPLWDFGVTCHPLLMIASKADPQHRKELLDRAQSLVAAWGSATSLVLLARAASEPASRAQLCREIASTMDPNEIPEGRAAVLAYGNGAPSKFDTYTARFEPKGAATMRPLAASDRLRLEVLNGRVIVDDRSIKLTPRELAVLTFLTRRRVGTPREELQDAVWPDLDAIKARDALYSLLHRLRKRTGKTAFVEPIGNAYRLAEKVQVDLWDVEFLAQIVQRGAPLDPDQVLRLYSTLQKGTNPHLRDFEWFAPIEFRVRECVRVLARYLISESKARGDQAAVLRYAADLIEEDACDEWAHELLIRHHLENNDRLEASRAYRKYCEILKQQIGASPTAEMRQIAQGANL